MIVPGLNRPWTTLGALLVGGCLAASATAQVYGPAAPPAANPPQYAPQYPAAQYPATQYPLQQNPGVQYLPGQNPNLRPAQPGAGQPGAATGQGYRPVGAYPHLRPTYVAPMPAGQPDYRTAGPQVATDMQRPGYPGASRIPAVASEPGSRAIRLVENQEPVAPPADPATQPVAPQTPNLATPTGDAQPAEHPLAAAIRRANSGFAEINKISDYSCTLVKRERIDGVLNEHEYMFVKVRHQPFSIYMYFLAPARVKGQEAMYVANQNDGNLLAHPNGIRHKLIGTVSLKPDSMLAMSGNRYPITELGIRRLTERLIEVGEHDMQFGECEVKMLQNAKINGRECTCIQVIHPTPRKEFIFHMARIYVDNQLNVPIRYEAYEWPKEPGGPPQLIEEYTYLNLKLNNGFTDQDFDARNPNYQFQ
jgi:uncharacterized protein DUF1571